jgi:hypothetical protein
MVNQNSPHSVNNNNNSSSNNDHYNNNNYNNRGFWQKEAFRIVG